MADIIAVQYAQQRDKASKDAKAKKEADDRFAVDAVLNFPAPTPLPDKSLKDGVYYRENSSQFNIKKGNASYDEAERVDAKWHSEVMGETYSSERRNNRIRLVSTQTSLIHPEGDIMQERGYDAIEFYITPEISESKSVSYVNISEIRQAASFLIYTGSPSRKWSINAKLLARTPKEADKTWREVQLLRSWTNPDESYQSNAKSGYGVPHVLKLYGYGKTWQGIPVVIDSLNIEYGSDVDYVQTDYGTNVPIIMSVSINLTEARSIDDLFKKFNLEQFKRGTLPGW